jgi:hypothetical protein
MIPVGGSVTFTVDYTILDTDPDLLVNVITVNGENQYGADPVSASDDHTVQTMGARTMGFWKTHPEEWGDWIPDVDSIFNSLSQRTLLSFLPRNDPEFNRMNQLEQLRAQLLAAELNVYYFDDRFDYSRYTAADIFAIIEEAELLLSGLPLDLDAFWSGLSKEEQNGYKQITDPLKDILDEFNNMGDEIFENSYTPTKTPKTSKGSKK